MDDQNPSQEPLFASSANPEIFPAWENPGKPLFERWLETVKGVFTSLPVFFTRMRTAGGLGAPLMFGVIGSSIGSIISQVFSMFLNIGILSLIAGQTHSREAVGNMVGQGIGGVCAIILIPFITAIGLFIGSGITHLFLMMLGGARKNFEATFRVNSYLLGSLGLLQAIPFCGGLVYIVWYIVGEIIGLAKAHEIPTSKAALAVLLPTVIVCACGAIAVLFLGMGILGLVAQRY